MIEDDETTPGPCSTQGPRPQDTDRAMLDFLVSSGVAAALSESREEACAADDRLLRVVAEAENRIKRMRAEQEIDVRYANRTLLDEIVPVLDSLALCVRHAEDGVGVEDLKQGISVTLTQFLRALANLGVEPIPAETGMPFEPDRHDAVSRETAPGWPANTITAVIQTGYTYKGRLLRPALVVVATG